MANLVLVWLIYPIYQISASTTMGKLGNSATALVKTIEKQIFVEKSATKLNRMGSQKLKLLSALFLKRVIIMLAHFF